MRILARNETPAPRTSGDAGAFTHGACSQPSGMKAQRAGRREGPVAGFARTQEDVKSLGRDRKRREVGERGRIISPAGWRYLIKPDFCIFCIFRRFAA